MPVRKVRLKDGSVGYQWGTTGKIYKKREDAEKQGIAILLSQRKKRRMKINKELYNELKEKVNSLEKLVNGGKGSGNFGHAGRPGQIGGSGDGTGGSKRSKVGDTFEYDGETFTVEEGPNGLEGVSKDRKRVVQVPEDRAKSEEERKKLTEVTSPDSNLGTTKEAYDKAKVTTIKRGGRMEVKKRDAGTYSGQNKFYDRTFPTRREAVAFQDGYNYKLDSKDRNFTQVDYIRTKDDKGNTRFEAMYKGSDYGVDGKAVWNNPIEAQRWTEGYNSAVTAIESEVPSQDWHRKK